MVKPNQWGTESRQPWQSTLFASDPSAEAWVANPYRGIDHVRFAVPVWLFCNDLA